MSARRAALACGLLAALSLAACGKKLEAKLFVGKWKSSRLSTPLVMSADGDWEIRTEDGTVLQYGVWQLEGERLMWTIRYPGGKVEHDDTAVLSVDKKAFAVRERDGSRTSFTRID